MIIRQVSGTTAIREMQRVRVVKKQFARAATLHSAFRGTFALNAIATNWRQSFRIPCGGIGRHEEQCVWSAKNSRPETQKHGNASSAPTSSLQMASQQACGKIEGIPNSAPCAKDVVDRPAPTHSALYVRIAEIQLVESEATAKSSSSRCITPACLRRLKSWRHGCAHGASHNSAATGRDAPAGEAPRKGRPLGSTLVEIVPCNADRNAVMTLLTTPKSLI